MMAIKLTDFTAAHQAHIPLYFCHHQLHGALYPRLTSRRQSIQIVAAQANRFCSQRQRFEYMGTTLNAAIEDHINFVAHRINNFGQMVKGTA